MTWTSPTIQRRQARLARESEESARLARPLAEREDCSRITPARFRAMSGADRNELLQVDAAKYRELVEATREGR